MENQIQEFNKNITNKVELSPTLNPNGIIAVYETHVEAELGVKQLQRSGFDMKKLSIVGRDFQNEETVIGFYNMGDRAKYWGKTGAFWGGLWGLLLGSAFFVIPGIGPLVIAGSFISVLVGAVEGALVVGGLSALGAALMSIGIPKNSIVEYESALKAGKYLMIAHGTTEELKIAQEIVKNAGAKNIIDFDAKDVSKEDSKVIH